MIADLDERVADARWDDWRRVRLVLPDVGLGQVTEDEICTLPVCRTDEVLRAECFEAVDSGSQSPGLEQLWEIGAELAPWSIV